MVVVLDIQGLEHLSDQFFQIKSTTVTHVQTGTAQANRECGGKSRFKLQVEIRLWNIYYI